MSEISIFNKVIGPVMRGPSSSHTAGAYHIATMARRLLGAEPAKASFTFDPDGSYGKVYMQQGADLAFAAGLMDWTITDERFPQALEAAAASGLDIAFTVEKLETPEHPNTVDIRLSAGGGQALEARASSIGGGAVEFTRLDGWPVLLTGLAHEIAMELESRDLAQALDLLVREGDLMGDPFLHTAGALLVLCAQCKTALTLEVQSDLEALPGFRKLRKSEPVFFIESGAPLFTSAEEMVALAKERGLSLGQAALQYEAALLGLYERVVLDEMARRFDVMRDAVKKGLEAAPPVMQLLTPSAGKIYKAESEGRLAVGGLHTRVAARAMAVMHVNGGMGVVCAAPTAGAAGTLPAVIVTLVEEMGLDKERAALALLAAGAVGVVLAKRATFAAEVAGCQVEIGAAGAMAAAAVVEAAGGSAEQAAHAAAISFQNTMGSVCDLVQGIVEIPCHTRNAVAASNAFLCADLILGGYVNPIPLDETIDAVYSVGKMLPIELRCTALGGLAATPSAKAMKRLR
jgi:L-serine dehydratase